MYIIVITYPSLPQQTQIFCFTDLILAKDMFEVYSGNKALYKLPTNQTRVIEQPIQLL